MIVFKTALIAALIAVITLMHYAAIPGGYGLYLLHTEHYFIPIILASLWFGLKVGFVTSGVISLIYAHHVFDHNPAHGTVVTVISYVFVFNLAAILLGWYVEQKARKQQEALELEDQAVLGRAAAALGHEMKDLLGALKTLTHQGEREQHLKLNPNLQKEMTRLESMVDVFSSLLPSDNLKLSSTDLNTIISEQVKYLQDTALKAGITIDAQLDENGCFTRIDTEKMGWILDNLIKNAVDTSPSGETVQILSQRGSASCQVQIRDHGSGIRKEDLPKIFTPFFTTKEKGYGLSLAVSRKIMRDLGGDLQVESQWGQGATFTITVPREQEPKSL